METLIIQISDKDADIVKEVLKRFNVRFIKKRYFQPYPLTAKTIEDAQKGIGLGEPIKDVRNLSIRYK